MSHEPVTINNRLINELFDSVHLRVCGEAGARYLLTCANNNAHEDGAMRSRVLCCWNLLDDGLSFLRQNRTQQSRRRILQQCQMRLAKIRRRKLHEVASDALNEILPGD